MHKGRPLIKPMVVVTTKGYFVSILGPYLADKKNNDSSILTHIIKSNAESIRSWLNEDDIFVVDRGFRDALPLLADLGIQAEMASFLEAGQKQMSTKDANMSRLVTRVSWVVESSKMPVSRDGDIWTVHYQPIKFHSLETKFGLSVQYPSMQQIFTSTKSCKQHRGGGSFIEEKGLQRKTVVWKATSEMDLGSFPTLDDEELRNLNCGTYQLKLSSSYMQEHIDGESDIYFHEEDNLVQNQDPK
ncbi:uncharacterized protein LOC134248601 [Saccostrea cucullata]|uniref:uncharacterized protein LOC134248601 n=1 Tax=Saccostrea cuccullata TaxID=36930 RepID=UPI002ED0CAB3